jgi:hypothetical protein
LVNSVASRAASISRKVVGDVDCVVSAPTRSAGMTVDAVTATGTAIWRQDRRQIG